MSKRSGSSKGSRNSKKTEGSDRSKNKIDLDKDPNLNLDKPDDIELDDKESGSNFGELSTELGLWEDEESGQSVSVVAGVDVVPLGINISANGDIGSVGVDIGLPGDQLGISANLQIDLETGDIIGGGGAIDYGGVSVGVDQIRKDGETCTTVTVTYFGVGASYQRCRKDDDDDEKDPKKEPPPDPSSNEIELPPDPPQIPGDPDHFVFCCGGYSAFLLHIINTETGISKAIIKSEGITTWGDGYEINQSVESRNFINYSFYGNESSTNIGLYYIPHTSEPFPGSGIAPYIMIKEAISNGYGWVRIKNGPFLHWSFRGTIRDANQYLQFANDQGPITGDNSFYYSWIRRNLGFYHVINTGAEIEPPEKTKEPDPPIPLEDDMSNCCNLEPVMSLLRKVSTAIGTDQLPANMPKSFLKNEGIRKIPSLAELQVYQIEVIDQLIGKFPIELEILDTDPLTPGDQTKKVVLQNLAESIAELFGLAINSSHDNAIQTSGVIKNLLEITLVRQAVLQNYYRLDAILDYLGAGLEEDETTFNSTISLPKDPNNISEDVADFLQNSEIKFAYDKLANPKDTLTAKLLPIQKAADIIKAKYWKGFGKAGGDYTGAIKEWLKTYDPKNEQNETDWKDKIDKILEEYAKDATGNIDKDRMPVIQNITQIGSEPAPEPEVKK